MPLVLVALNVASTPNHNLWQARGVVVALYVCVCVRPITFHPATQVSANAHLLHMAAVHRELALI